MQDRIWKNLANVKFQSIYTSKVSRRTYNIGNTYSFFLAFASTSSVATWAIWNEFSLMWASVVGVSQFLHIAKPYVPFIKHEKEYRDMSLLYESLYLAYERLWYDFSKGVVDSEKLEETFFNLRKQEHNLSTRFKHVICPEYKSLILKADEQTNKFIENNF